MTEPRMLISHTDYIIDLVQRMEALEARVAGLELPDHVRKFGFERTNAILHKELEIMDWCHERMLDGAKITSVDDLDTDTVIFTVHHKGVTIDTIKWRP